jgi:PRTRC genetic system protein A
MNIPTLVERKFLRSTDQPITAPLYEIVIAQNGVFKRAKRREMRASVELSSFTIKIPELASGVALVQLTEKISARIFEEILAHARNSTDAANFTENLYAVFWNEETGNYAWDEISRHRNFGSTIGRDDSSAYKHAILEIHTHPPNCRNFSGQDNRDESGKFRLFGILVDIHSAKPFIRLRVGVYDSFWEIPVETISDTPLETLKDLVKQEEERLEKIYQNLERKEISYICAEDYQFSLNQIYIENL